MTRAERLNKYKEARLNPKGPAKRLYTLSEAAFYLGRTVNAMRQLVWSGRLPFLKDGKRVFLDVKDLDAYIERTKQSFTY